MTGGDSGIADLIRGAFAAPLRLTSRRPVTPPRKALILQPCCLGRVMLTTPLLAALSIAYPAARFDWAASDWVIPAVAANPRVTRVIRTAAGDWRDATQDEQKEFLENVREEAYDTCFIPGTTGRLARLARRAGIKQRIGLAAGLVGLSNTTAVRLPAERQNRALSYLALATAAGAPPEIVQGVEMEFEPPDRDRTAVTRWLVEDFNWLGDTPLVIIHPSGGDNPEQTNLDKRWPAERYARLANHLARTYGARIVLVGLSEGRSIAGQVAGMMSFPAANRAGDLPLGELGALCEMARLYVGNDVGSTYVAAATGCPTLTIYGPTDPAISAPYMINSRVETVWRPFAGEFSWSEGVSVDEAVAAADRLMQPQPVTCAA